MRREFAELDGHDAYDLLGVAPDASSDEIRRAHISRVREHHPDRFQDDAAKAEGAELTRLLNVARDVLSQHRASYDVYRAPVEDEPAEEPEIVDDPWDTATTGRPAAGRPPTAPPRQRTPSPPPPWPPPRTPSPPPPGRRDAPYRRMPPPPTYSASPTWPPPPASFHPARPGARNRTGIVLAVLAVAVVVLIGFILVVGLVVHNAAPEPKAVVPARLAGVWKGTAKDWSEKKGDDGWDAELRLREGRHNGEVRYVHGRYVGIAVPLSMAGRTLNSDTVFPDEQEGCDVGDISLNVAEKGKAEITFSSSGQESAAGTLTRG